MSRPRAFTGQPAADAERKARVENALSRIPEKHRNGVPSDLTLSPPPGAPPVDLPAVATGALAFSDVKGETAFGVRLLGTRDVDAEAFRWIP